MCSSSFVNVPIMTNLNADSFYKEFNKFTRRKDLLQHQQQTISTSCGSISRVRWRASSTPDATSSEGTMGRTEEVLARDQLEIRLTCESRCAVKSVIRLSCYVVNSALVMSVVMVVLLSLVGSSTAASSIGHVDDKVVS